MHMLAIIRARRLLVAMTVVLLGALTLPVFMRSAASATARANPAWAVQRWDLVSASGHHLATTGPFRNGRFTVNWDSYG